MYIKIVLMATQYFETILLNFRLKCTITEKEAGDIGLLRGLQYYNDYQVYPLCFLSGSNYMGIELYLRQIVKGFLILALRREVPKTTNCLQWEKQLCQSRIRFGTNVQCSPHNSFNIIGYLCQLHRRLVQWHISGPLDFVHIMAK